MIELPEEPVPRITRVLPAEPPPGFAKGEGRGFIVVFVEWIGRSASRIARWAGERQRLLSPPS